MRWPRMLWLQALGKLAARQGMIEGFGAPGYGLTLAFPKTEGFAAGARDFRPIDPGIGRAARGGRCVFSLAMMYAPKPSDPLVLPCPNRAFAV